MKVNKEAKPSKGNQEPLIYIQQPNFHVGASNMQATFRTSTKVFEHPKKTKPPKQKEEAILQDVVEIEDAQEDELAEEIHTDYSFTPVKPFRLMDLDEKIKYLTGFSGRKAPFPCEFISTELRAKGIIQQMNGKYLEIKTFTNDSVIINRDDLRDIRMIGLM
ncbi:CotO family spore coat protein [Falsibacillus albus]|uniref:Spore coat protein CotO n=1 Tax=Falsibacillus albus TaxID=2478915 RepID=A0A3L7K245_9BACI|nr:CotO family spore coat protein [Falsibacillus albus]RLQ97167.1 hypothetical protein D9X91_03165 [Falsibacillus albus]